MSDQIRFISIELDNYRQYYSNTKIDFSSREEGFTVIAGKNGEGKSNLLNAITWCLFREEPHGSGDDNSAHKTENKSLPIFNNRYIDELKPESEATTSVKIWIEKGDEIYSISRVLTVLKHKLEKNAAGAIIVTQFGDDKVPKGCEILEERGGLVVKKKGPNDADFHDTIRDASPDVMLQTILPKGLKKYFLLDGEFLEGFWKDSTNIETGIEQVAQLHLLSGVKTHLNKVNTPSKGYAKDTDELTNRIQQLSWEENSLDEDGNEKFSEETRWKLNTDDPDLFFHASGVPRIKDLESDIEKMKNRQRDIFTDISESGPSNVKLLKEKYDKDLEQLEGKKEELKKISDKYRYNLVVKSPYILLQNSIEDSISIINERVGLGDLPIGQRRRFADELLQRGKCVCHEPLESKVIDGEETNPKRKILEKYRDELTGREDLDPAVDMKDDFLREFVDNEQSFKKTYFGEPRVEFIKLEDAVNSLNNELKDTKLKLGNAGDDTTTELINEQQYLQDQITELQNKKVDLELRKGMNAKERGDTKRVLETALVKNKKARKMVHEMNVWDKISGHIEIAYNELKEEIRNDIQDNTWKNFQELLANSTEFKSFAIEPNYAASLLDTHGNDKIRNLSAGQGLILTLAFISALREPTGYKFPLVIDSPLGKIDSCNRFAIANGLPDYLPEEQLTLLVTDTEYCADLPPDADCEALPKKTPFAKHFQNKIKLKHWKIKKDKTGDNTGNSTIKPAELSFDKEQEGWVVQ